MKHSPSPWRGIALACVVTLTVSGCATSGNPRDPFEKFNRSMFAFNDAVDRAALKPAATVYKNALPSFVQTGVNNFFGNLSDAWSAVNNLLQGKGEAGLSDVTRFTLNSTLGLAGLLDIASEAGLQKHNEDFGQTLGVWGVSSGPYLMLPLLGPSTVRDALVLPLDVKADPWAYKEPVRWRNVGIALRAVDQRAVVLDASNLMEEAALDRYEFIRDGFLQRRQSRVFDGESPPRPKTGDKDAPADAKSIKAAYGEDDVGPVTPAQAPAAPPDTPAAETPAPAIPPPVSSEPASK
jgi:phospholipid-binding lipoprotein MlaA